MLGQIVDWFYGQIVGFLGNFFSEMGGMGAELFEMSWVQSVVLFFSYLGWALFAMGLVVACFECGVEYSSGRGNVKEAALNAIKGFLAVSLFTQVLLSVLALTQAGTVVPLVVTAALAFLCIRHGGVSMLDFLRYAAAFFFFGQQYYEWRERV